MNGRKWFALGVLANIATLLVGVLIGIAFRSPVYARTPVIPPANVEEVDVNFEGSSAAFGILLAHQAETDVLVVNGYDIMKMNQGILNYLASRPLAERPDIDKIVKEAIPDKFYKLKAPTPEPQTPAKKEPK